MLRTPLWSSFLLVVALPTIGATQSNQTCALTVGRELPDVLHGRIDDPAHDLQIWWNSSSIRPSRAPATTASPTELWTIFHCLSNSSAKPLIFAWEKAGMYNTANSPLLNGYANSSYRTVLNQPIVDWDSPIVTGYRHTINEASTYQRTASNASYIFRGTNITSSMEAHYRPPELPGLPGSRVASLYAIFTQQIRENGYTISLTYKSNYRNPIYLGFALKGENKSVFDVLMLRPGLEVHRQTLGSFVPPRNPLTVSEVPSFELKLAAQEFVFIRMNGLVTDISATVLQGTNFKFEDGGMILLDANRIPIAMADLSFLQTY